MFFVSYKIAIPTIQGLLAHVSCIISAQKKEYIFAFAKDFGVKTLYPHFKKITHKKRQFTNKNWENIWKFLLFVTIGKK